MRKKPPCYQNGSDCPRRKLLCHGACKEFQAWKAEEEEKKRIADAEREKVWITFSEGAKKAVNRKIKEGRK